MGAGFSSERLTARRPDIFRALGPGEPPASISAGGAVWDLIEVIKHDSWAATAVYGGAGGRKLAVKFNRIQRLPFGIPAAWIGHFLAKRERRVLDLMAGTSGFPRCPGEVSSSGHVLPNAVAHEWIEGVPFEPSAKVGDHFFPQLERMLAKFHSAGLAYVDMSKWGNIIVGSDGNPYLIDYQIHLHPWRWAPLGFLLRMAQSADRFYLRRHWRRCRPDQVAPGEMAAWSREPAHVWFVERAGFIFRGLRIGILRLKGVRGDPRKDNERRLLETSRVLRPR